MKTNPMTSRRSYRMVFVLMPVFLMTFILLSPGSGGRAMAAEPYTEPANAFEVVSCNPVAACFLSILQQIWPTPEVGPNQPVVWDQGPETPDLQPDDRPPNIILILADDMGFNDVSFYAEQDGRTPTFQTPNIDAVATQGVVFNNGYASHATCAPSRAAIMTGQYPTRFGYEFNPRQNAMFTPMQMLQQCSEDFYKRILHTDLLEERGEKVLGMPQSVTTLAEKLKDAGYHAAHIGKWHLGGNNFMRPEDQGFDESLYMAGSLYLPEDSPDVVNAYLTYNSIDMISWLSPYAAQFNRGPSSDGKGGPMYAPKGYKTDYYTDEAVNVIKANKNRPFFLYLAYHGIHTPLQAKKEDFDAIVQAYPLITDHRMRVYMAMIKALDRGVGRVIEALEDNGIDNNTLVIFTSDNGGASYLGLPDINQPYRGWKATFFEGGTHVPFFMKWPKEITPGTVYDKPIAQIDILPTAAVAAGLTLPGDGTLDGVDLVPYVTGTDSGTPHDTLFWRSGYYQGVLSRDSDTGEFWKMQVSDRPDKVWLYNLSVDPTEQTNLAEDESYDARVLELKALLDAHNAVQADPLWPYVSEGPNAIDKTGEEPILETDEYVYWPL